MREKKRYLQFEVISEERLDFGPISDAIWASFLGLFGTYGAAKAGLMVLRERFEGEKGIAKVSVKHVDELKMALMMIRNIDGKQVMFRTRKVSGIIAKIGG